MKKNLLLQYLFLPVLLLFFVACKKTKTIRAEQPSLINQQNEDSLSKSDSSDISYPTVKIGRQVWMANNLDVVVFRNGDTIREASSEADWTSANENKVPAWCRVLSIDNKSFGKIYNYFALIDKRGIAPEGWRVPTDNDWNILRENPYQLNKNIIQNVYWVPKKYIDKKFQNPYGGYRYQKYKGSPYYAVLKNGFYWTADGDLATTAIGKDLNFWYGSINKAVGSDYLGIDFGFYIRCVK